MAESLDITQFKGHFISGSRPNLYKMRCARLGQDLEFLCKAASLPASTIETIEVPYLGRQIKVPGNRTFDTFEITVINDINFGIRRAVEGWMNEINSHRLNSGFAAVRDVFSDAEVIQLGRDGEELYSYMFKDLYPTELSQIDLGFDSNSEISEYTISFDYSYWESIETT